MKTGGMVQGLVWGEEEGATCRKLATNDVRTREFGFLCNNTPVPSASFRMRAQLDIGDRIAIIYSWIAQIICPPGQFEGAHLAFKRDKVLLQTGARVLHMMRERQFLA